MRRTLFCGVLIILSRAAPAIGQTDEFANRLVVMIKAGSSQGAGIVCGADTRGIYIATADHVVRPGTTPARISVNFFHQPDREVSAELLPQRDATLDIAVLRVPVTPELQSLPFHHKADLSSLRRGSEVYLLGNPGGRAWRMSMRPESIAQIRGDLLEFESNLITGGHSGGALLTVAKDIAGMLRSDNPPYGEAVSIDRVLDRLKSWGYPVTLRLPLPRITMGRETNCVLDSSGEARCWSVRNSKSPVRAIAGSRFRELSAGWDHVCGIAIDEQAVCWGDNEDGQLGIGKTGSEEEAPVPVSGAHRFITVTAGRSHTCALDEAHRAYCWGGGYTGLLGNNSAKGSPAPVAVVGGLRFRSLAAGEKHTCGVTENGELYCWGGILGVGGHSKLGRDDDAPDVLAPLRVPGSTRFRTVSAGRHLSCATSVDGDGYCWGSGDRASFGGLPRPEGPAIARVPGKLKFESISVGKLDHACGLTTDSRVYCWGVNAHGQLGDGSKEDSMIPVAVGADLIFESVTAGFEQSCAVAGTSTYCWGNMEGNDGKPARYAALGGRPGNVRSVVTLRASSATVPFTGELPAVEWRGTLEHPLSGFPYDCRLPAVEFLGHSDGSFTLQLKCSLLTNTSLSATLKSSGGARSMTGQIGEKEPHNLDKGELDRWAPSLEREALALTEALAYPRLVTKSARRMVHPSGRIDDLEFDARGHLTYLSAAPAAGKPMSLEIWFAEYRPADRIEVPFEIHLANKEVVTVLKLREIRFSQE
jgi:alpha-tubulin suppressor-like RCC1 family protein